MHISFSNDYKTLRNIEKSSVGYKHFLVIFCPNLIIYVAFDRNRVKNKQKGLVTDTIFICVQYSYWASLKAYMHQNCFKK